MNEKRLLKICLITSILGIFLLLSIAEFSQPKFYQINDITEKQIDTQIKIQGTITKSKDLPGLLIFDLKDNTSKMTVIAFKDFQINLTKGENVSITGKIAEYKNVLEIIADEITIKNDS